MSRRFMHSWHQSHLVPTSGWPLRACRRCSASGERAETGAGVLRRCYTLFGLRSALACAASAAWQRGERDLLQTAAWLCSQSAIGFRWLDNKPLRRGSATSACPCSTAHADALLLAGSPGQSSDTVIVALDHLHSLQAAPPLPVQTPAPQTRPAASACPCSLPGQPHEP